MTRPLPILLALLLVGCVCEPPAKESASLETPPPAVTVVLNASLREKAKDFEVDPGVCLVLCSAEIIYGEWQVFPDGCHEKPIPSSIVEAYARRWYPRHKVVVVAVERVTVAKGDERGRENRSRAVGGGVRWLP